MYGYTARYHRNSPAAMVWNSLPFGGFSCMPQHHCHCNSFMNQFFQFSLFSQMMSNMFQPRVAYQPTYQQAYTPQYSNTPSFDSNNYYNFNTYNNNFDCSSYFGVDGQGASAGNFSTGNLGFSGFNPFGASRTTTTTITPVTTTTASAPVTTTTAAASTATATSKPKKVYQKTEIVNLACQIAKKYGVDERLVLAVIEQESGFKVNAESPCGAQGLMQLMPATAKELGVKDAYDPAQNIEGGVKLLKQLLDKFGGDVKKALAAYNWGPNRAALKQSDWEKHLPKETKNYVARITANYPNISIA